MHGWRFDVVLYLGLHENLLWHVDSLGNEFDDMDDGTWQLQELKLERDGEK
jgi:hypothetical protein